MSLLPDFLHLSREVWIAGGVGALFGIVSLAIIMRTGRRRHVTLGSSPATELFAFQLARIADALERISMDGVSITREIANPSRESAAPSRDAAPPPDQRGPATRHVSMSMFGR